MARITKISPAKGRARYVQVEIDGEPLGAIPERLLEEQGLGVGSTLGADTLRALRDAGQLAEALAIANAFIAHRPRSTAEVTQRLRRAHVDEDTLHTVLETLREQQLLDDARFAALWVESRTSFSPRSARMLEYELRKKGIDRDAIATVIGSTTTDDEVEAAVAAGRKRLRAFGSLDEEDFRRRMAGFLARRGFRYETVEPALATLWSELQRDAGS
jgi:regulatory protein